MHPLDLSWYNCWHSSWILIGVYLDVKFVLPYTKPKFCVGIWKNKWISKSKCDQIELKFCISNFFKDLQVKCSKNPNQHNTQKNHSTTIRVAIHCALNEEPSWWIVTKGDKIGFICQLESYNSNSSFYMTFEERSYTQNCFLQNVWFFDRANWWNFVSSSHQMDFSNLSLKR